MRIRTISRKFGVIEFSIIGNRARQLDGTGVYWGPTATFDSSVKWILDQLEHMRKESPDLTFDPL